MNPGLVVKLRPSGPWRIGPDSGARNRVDVIYHSDSLYSAVTAAMSRLGWLAEWLDATARTGTPAVSFSSCFPYLGKIAFVVPPRTVWPPASPSAKAARVRWKSARFVPLTVVQSILAGKNLDENNWSVDGASDCLVPSGKPGPFRTAVRSNAGIDRLTGASERHSTACIEFRAGSGLWTVVSFEDQAAADQWSGKVKAAFRLLADTGFGGERSRGWGRSETPEFIDGMLPDLILPAVEPVVEAKVKAPAPVAPLVVEPEPETEAFTEPQPQVSGLTEEVTEVPAIEAAPEPEPAPESETVAVDANVPVVEAAPEVPAPEPEPEPEPETEALTEPQPQGSGLTEEVTELPAIEAAPQSEPAPESETVAVDANVPVVETAPEAPAIEAVPEPEPTPEPEVPPTHSGVPTHPHWLLSLFTPAPADSVDWRRGNYTVLARSGRVESPAGSGELKKQIQMVAEGSVLYAETAPRGSAADVAPDGFAHPVFRAGFAVAIPLPEVR
jgi:CRISPR type III-A-associated RAMP protein Csm4